MTHKVAFILDTSPSIPENYLKQYPIHLVHNIVVWEGKDYKDWLDISQQSLFEGLAAGREWPTTTAPAPEPFQTLYVELLEQGYDILVVFPPTKITMGADAARIAAQDFPPDRITVVESTKLGMVNGWAVILAARAAQAGATLAECAALVEKLTKQGEYIGTLNTLESLHKGGRIGGAAHFMGAALNLKPILEMRNSRVEGVMRVRTRKKALRKTFEYFKQSIPAGKRIYLAGMHAQADEEMAQLMQWANDSLDIVEQVVVPLPPSNCVHYGLGAVGFAYIWVD